MDFEIVWSDPAIDSLRAIVTEVANDNPSAAFALGMRLVDRMEIALQFPDAGPVYQQAQPLVVRCFTVENYRLYYRVFRDRHFIEVLAVRHCARAQPVF